jgi:hypothetical protein
MDRVHDTMVHGCMRYIKLRPSKSGSTDGILKVEGVYGVVILVVESKMDDLDLKERRDIGPSNPGHWFDDGWPIAASADGGGSDVTRQPTVP